MATQYLVRSIHPGDAVVTEAILAAATEAELRTRLREEGHAVLSIRAAPKTSLRSTSDRLDVPAWCRELSTLLRAGMTAVEAIETLQLQASRSGSDIQARLLEGLHQGQSLSSAMRSAGGFPQVLIASVIASERTSRLADALDDYLGYDAQLAALRRQALSAAVYPAVVVCVGGAIALFLLAFVMPRFSKMYASFHGGVSGVTQFMLWLSGMLSHSLPIVLSAVILTGVGIVFAYRQGFLGRLGSALVEASPALTRARDDFLRAKLFQALMLTLKGGYPLVQALAVCESLHLGRDIDRQIERARRSVEQGVSASRALVAEGLVDRIGERLLGVGERSGQFERVLQTLAQRHAEAFATFVQRATRLVEPLLLLVVAVLVGGIVIMMYMPVFDIANTLR